MSATESRRLAQGDGADGEEAKKIRLVDDFCKYVFDSFRNLLIAASIGYVGRQLVKRPDVQFAAQRIFEFETTEINLPFLTQEQTGWVLIALSFLLMSLAFLTVFAKVAFLLRAHWGLPWVMWGWVGAATLLYGVGWTIFAGFSVVYIASATMPRGEKQSKRVPDLCDGASQRCRIPLDGLNVQ